MRTHLVEDAELLSRLGGHLLPSALHICVYRLLDGCSEREVNPTAVRHLGDLVLSHFILSLGQDGLRIFYPDQSRLSQNCKNTTITRKNPAAALFYSVFDPWTCDISVTSLRYSRSITTSQILEKQTLEHLFGFYS